MESVGKEKIFNWKWGNHISILENGYTRTIGRQIKINNYHENRVDYEVGAQNMKHMYRHYESEHGELTGKWVGEALQIFENI